MFAPFGQKAHVGVIANHTAQAIHKSKGACKEKLIVKRKIVKQAAKDTIRNSAVVVRGHHVDKLMRVLDIMHNAVTNKLTEDSNVEGTADETENKLEMWKVLIRRLIKVYRNRGKIKGLQILPEFTSWSMELAVRTSVNKF